MAQHTSDRCLSWKKKPTHGRTTAKMENLHLTDFLGRLAIYKIGKRNPKP